MARRRDLRVNAAAALARARLPRRAWELLGRPEAWLVGGWVRDRLLGRASRDLDLVLAGDHAAVGAAAARAAAALGVRPLALGRPPRAIWRVETADLRLELWPLGELDLEADARRRDFTVNALHWRLPSGPLVDRVGGLGDLAAMCLRAISRANLERDPLRLLRGPRLLAELPGFAIEPATRRWIAELAPALAGSPRERVGAELERLLEAPGAERGFREAVRLGLVAAAAPGPAPPGAGRGLAPALGRLAGTRPHPIPAAVRAAGPAARLALVLLAWELPGERTLASYAWPAPRRRAARTAATALETALRAARGTPADRREAIWRAGAAFPAVLALAAALRPGLEVWRAWWRMWRRRGPELLELRPPLDPREVARLAGVSPGPELGRLLAALERAAARGEVRTPQSARRMLCRVLRGRHPALC